MSYPPYLLIVCVSGRGGIEEYFPGGNDWSHQDCMYEPLRTREMRLGPVLGAEMKEPSSVQEV